MSATRPSFEKKELALSGTPFLYLPTDMPTFTVEVCHREEIDGELLQRALDRTLRRMPYLSDTMEIDHHGAVYYAKNPLPMVAAHTSALRRVGGADTNYHMLDLTWDGKITWFSMFHGFCDGQGINAFLESVLYHYYCLKDGVDYDPMGIRTDKESASEAEVFEPLSRSYEIDPGFVMPERKEQRAPYHLPELAATPSTELKSYGMSLSSGAFMDFVRQNQTSPAVALSMLMGEAVQRVHPEADAPIFSNIPISVRPMLGCEETFKNCSSRALLPLTGTPLDALPFAQRAAALRVALKKQMDPNITRTTYNYLRQMYQQRMTNAVSYAEELKKPAGFTRLCHDSFYIDYIGRLRPTAYADSITAVHFLCKPAGGKTLHLNMIEHNARFQIECLASHAVPQYADALAETLRAHGLEVLCAPVRRLDLPLTAWREGIDY